jgi:ATP-binding cassette subfamily B (MDR/TAP) protein 1
MIDDGKNSPIDGLSTTGIKPPQNATGRIELRNVNFHYPTRPGVQVCKGYNLTIEPGEVVALVGPSGSGKSTIMSLLLRFYDTDSGDVLLDGQSVRDLNVRWLRNQIGYVGQEPVLFTGSIRDNILKGKAEIDVHLSDGEEVLSGAGDVEGGLPANGNDLEVIDAAKTSNAHEFISSFPSGYDTDVGEGSIMVSGGQKQRIAIARALVKKPAVLLLDEATSALDTASERIVQESIDKLQESKAQTTIVIAHRLSTIRNADKIAVIDKGEVVEMGTHDELLALEGLYHQLWSKQGGLKRGESGNALTRTGSNNALSQV